MPSSGRRKPIKVSRHVSSIYHVEDKFPRSNAEEKENKVSAGNVGITPVSPRIKTTTSRRKSKVIRKILQQPSDVQLDDEDLDKSWLADLPNIDVQEEIPDVVVIPVQNKELEIIDLEKQNGYTSSSEEEAEKLQTPEKEERKMRSGAKSKKKDSSEDETETSEEEKSSSEEDVKPVRVITRSTLARREDDTTTVKCTACYEQVNQHNRKSLRSHPVLSVLICRRCDEFYKDGSFSQDADGSDEQCQWCAEGGNLICCDFCPKAFCKRCICFNLGRKEWTRIATNETAKWRCYACKPIVLKELIKFCKSIMRDAEAAEENERKTKASSSSSFFYYLEGKRSSCDYFQEKMKIFDSEISQKSKKALVKAILNTRKVRTKLKAYQKQLEVALSDLLSSGDAAELNDFQDAGDSVATSQDEGECKDKSVTSKNIATEKSQSSTTESEGEEETAKSRKKLRRKEPKKEKVCSDEDVKDARDDEKSKKTKNLKLKEVRSVKVVLPKKNKMEEGDSQDEDEKAAEIELKKDIGTDDEQVSSTTALKGESDNILDGKKSKGGKKKTGGKRRKRSSKQDVVSSDEEVLDMEDEIKDMEVDKGKDEEEVRDGSDAEKMVNDERENKMEEGSVDNEKSNEGRKRKRKKRVPGNKSTSSSKNPEKDTDEVENKKDEEGMAETGDKKVEEDMSESGDEKVEDEMAEIGDEKVEDMAETGDEKVEDMSEIGDEKVEDDIAEIGNEKVEGMAETGDEKVEEDMSEIGDEKVEDDMAETGDEKVEDDMAEIGDEKVEDDVAEIGDEKVEDDMAETGDEKVNDDMAEIGDEKVEDMAETGDEKVEDDMAETGDENAEDDMAETGNEKVEDDMAEIGDEKVEDDKIVEDKIDNQLLDDHLDENKPEEECKDDRLEPAEDAPSEKKNSDPNSEGDEDEDDLERLLLEAAEQEDGDEKKECEEEAHSSSGEPPSDLPQVTKKESEKKKRKGKKDKTENETKSKKTSSKKKINLGDKDDESKVGNQEKGKKRSKKADKEQNNSSSDSEISLNDVDLADEYETKKRRKRRTKKAEGGSPSCDTDSEINIDEKIDKLKAKVQKRKKESEDEAENLKGGKKVKTAEESSKKKDAEKSDGSDGSSDSGSDLDRKIDKLDSLDFNVRSKKAKTKDKDASSEKKEAKKKEKSKSKKENKSNDSSELEEIDLEMSSVNEEEEEEEGEEHRNDKKKKDVDITAAEEKIAEKRLLEELNEGDDNVTDDDLSDSELSKKKAEGKTSKGKNNKKKEKEKNDKEKKESDKSDDGAQNGEKPSKQKRQKLHRLLKSKLISSSSSDSDRNGEWSDKKKKLDKVLNDDDDDKEKKKKKKRKKGESDSDDRVSFNSNDSSEADSTEEDSIEEDSNDSDEENTDSSVGKKKKSKKKVGKKSSRRSRNRGRGKDSSDKEEGNSRSSDSSVAREKVRQVKKRKRKRGRDSSDKGSSDDFQQKKKNRANGARKRKRIKKAMQSGSESEVQEITNENGNETGSHSGGSDSDNALTPKSKGRRHIRKIMTKKKLQQETVEAAKQEKERRERILRKRQELLSQNVIEDSPKKSSKIERIVLDINSKTKEVLLEVDKGLLKSLKPHQEEGVRFMWENMFESMDKVKEPGNGCILAHCMGLGKTLQVITLLHAVMKEEKVGVKTALVVAPLNTVLNWEAEFEKWQQDLDYELDVYELTSFKDNQSRSEVLRNWQKNGGVMIMGYSMFRNLSSHCFVKKKRQKEAFTQTLVDPGPDIVVCDEGHLLKNDATAIAKAMNLIKTQRRVCLTGTPLQNNLKEYHCMVHFVKPSLLGTRREFNNRFVNPISNGQCADSSPMDVKVMKKRAHILHKLLKDCVQRKDYSSLAPFLPPKHEYVVLIRLSKVQIELYERYINSKLEKAEDNRHNSLFQDYQVLMNVWTHPYLLKRSEIRTAKRQENEEMRGFVDDEDTEESDGSLSDVKDTDSDDELISTIKQGKDADDTAKPSTSSGKKNKDNDSDSSIEVIKTWNTRSRGTDAIENLDVDPEPAKEKIFWYTDLVKEEEARKIEISGKMIVLFEIIKMAEAVGEKVLVFSQSLLALNLMEEILEDLALKNAEEKARERKQKLSTKEDVEIEIEMYGTWTKNVDYFRIDGSTEAHQRKSMADRFNRESNLRPRLFLVSTRAGSLGINLVAASRVVIFDASWNPSHDIQSIFRVYRFGQTKAVFIYRLIAQGTMEERIYDRQVTKLSLSQRVVDEHQIKRHFTFTELSELYNFNPDRLDDPDREERPTPILPKDFILAELLNGHKEWLVTYHEHDSLLENVVDESLTEEERKLAWAEYENEGKMLTNPMAGIQNVMPGMQGDMLYEQQAVPNMLNPMHASAQGGMSAGYANQLQRLQMLMQMQNASRAQGHPHMTPMQNINHGNTMDYLMRMPYAQPNNIPVSHNAQHRPFIANHQSHPQGYPQGHPQGHPQGIRSTHPTIAQSGSNPTIVRPANPTVIRSTNPTGIKELSMNQLLVQQEQQRRLQQQQRMAHMASTSSGGSSVTSFIESSIKKSLNEDPSGGKS